MSKFTFILLIISHLTAFSQHVNQEKEKGEIGVVYSLDHYFLKNTIRTEDYFGYDLRSLFSFSTGLIGLVILSPKISMGMGLIFSLKDFHGQGCSICRGYYSPEGAYVRMNYLELPLLVKYSFLDKKIDIYIQSGLNPSIVLNELPDPPPDFSNDKFLISGLFGIGISYDLYYNTNLSFTTMYRNSFPYLFRTDFLKLRSIGLIAGVAYKL